MAKQKVLIVSRNLMAGGIETSYLNFIQNMKNSVELETFLCNKSGILKQKLPEDIVLYEGNKILKFLTPADGVSGKEKNQKLKKILRKIIKFFYNLLGFKKFLKFYAIKTTKKIKKEYDCALCFYAQNDLCCDVALKKVNAKQKFAFIHADVSKSPINKRSLKMLTKFDKILCVSNSCANVFKQVYPHLANKVDYLYNFQDVEKIKNQSTEFIVNYPNGFNIVTVARLSETEKGFLRSLEVFNNLHKQGFKFHWHIVGEGIDRGVIEEYISVNNMKDYVTLHGNQVNPYPYIKAADLFYLGSYHESWGLVIVEALTLNVPVLTTNTCSAHEILGDKCFICENDKISISSSLKYIIENKNILEVKKEEIQDYYFDNDIIKEKFLNFLMVENE